MTTDSVLIVNRNIQKYLLESGITPRSDAGPGIWLSFLLPVALMLSEYKHSTRNSKYRVTACLSCGFLCYTVFFLLLMGKNMFSKKKAHLILSCFITIILLYFSTSEGIAFSVGYGTLCVVSYDLLIFPVMKMYPKSFTFGEATVVTQAFVLFLITFLIKNISSSTNCFIMGTMILQVGMLCVICIGILSYIYNLAMRPKEFYLLLVLIVALIMLPSLYVLTGQNPITWIILLILEDKETIQLFGFWLVCSMMGVFAVLIQLRSRNKASTIVRKVFHFLALLVFIPGIIIKPCLIYVASGVTFAIFVGLDMIRALKLPPMGTILQESFKLFADKKDEGPISLTPLYLLVGCSLPLWIHPDPQNSELLPLMSGLLAIGLGDAVASICGTLVGKNKWRGSDKTKEGTMACFLSQLFLVIALIHFGYVPRTNLIKPTFAIALTSLVEAKTDQIDNLALPLLMYICLI